MVTFIGYGYDARHRSAELAASPNRYRNAEEIQKTPLPSKEPSDSSMLSFAEACYLINLS